MNLAKFRPRIGTLAVASGVAAALAMLAVILHWQGGDWPGQLYRVNLFRRVGFTQWDNQWYGGHSTPAYSLLFPPLGGILGPSAVGVASAVLATWCFARLAVAHFEARAARVASVWFAAGTVTNLAVGRLTFALGMAIGLAAAVALSEDRRTLAWFLAVLTPLASPVAGVFLAIAAAGSTYARRHRWTSLGVGALALLPIGALALAFPEGGRFPFLGDAALTIGVALVGAAIAPRKYVAVRVAALVYAAVAVVAFVVPNPLGGNVTRMATYFTGPILAGIFWGTRRWIVALLAVPLLIWQWQPAFDAIFTAGQDPSSKAAYFDPLLGFLGTRAPTRIEIPFTLHHWEADYVAPKVPLARGWERQLDIGLNPLFYQPTPLPAGEYRSWLVANAVQYVALPDAALDASSVQEAAVLRAGVPGLSVVWQNAHWRVWQVLGTQPLVDGPGHLAQLGPESFTLEVDQPGRFVVRIRYTSHWQVEANGGCVSESPDGWTVVNATSTGQLRVHQVVIGGADNDGCTAGRGAPAQPN